MGGACKRDQCDNSNRSMWLRSSVMYFCTVAAAPQQLHPECDARAPNARSRPITWGE